MTAAILCLFLTSGFAPRSATAEQPENNAQAQPPKLKPGYHVGGLRMRPTISVTARYDDNVFTTARNTRSDWLLLIAPSVRVDSTAPDHRVTLKAGADIGRFDTYTDEDFEDTWIDLDGRYELSDRAQLFGGVGLKYSHEPRDSQDARIGGLEPTTFRTATANAGIKWRSGEVTYRTGATFETLDFDNVPAVGGKIINSDRDRDLIGLGLRASYHVDADGEVFVQALADRRRYQKDRDQFGFERDSDGYRLAAGFRKGFGQGEEFEAFLGALAQDYDDPRFSNIQRVDFGGRLRLSPSADTRFSLTLQRALNETTDPGSPGYLNTGVSARLSRARTSRLQPYLSLGYSEADYLETGRDDRQLSIGVGGKYFLTRNTAVSVGISHLDRDSNDKGLSSLSNDFVRNQFFITLTSQVYPFNRQ